MAAEVYPGPFAQEAKNYNTNATSLSSSSKSRNSEEGVDIGIAWCLEIKPDHLGNIFKMDTESI